MTPFNKISKITKFTFTAISVSILSIAMGSSLITNAQSSDTKSINSSFLQNSQDNSNGFLGKMGKGFKNSFEGMKDGAKSGGKMDSNMMNKISGKMSSKIKKEAEKYKIDQSLVQSVTDAQKATSDAQTAVKTGRKDKVANLTELQTKATDARKTLRDSMKKFQNAVFDGRITEAKTLGVDGNVIEKLVNAKKTQTENMDKMEILKNNPDTKISEVKALKTQMKIDHRTMKEAQKAFHNAVKTKSPVISQPSTPATPIVTN